MAERSGLFKQFSTLWRGSPCRDPSRKGLEPARYCKDRRSCLRCPQSNLPIPRNDDMVRHSLWRKRQLLHHLLPLIGIDPSKEETAPCQGPSMPARSRWSSQASIFQVADITISFLTRPISFNPILMLETGKLSCCRSASSCGCTPIFISF